MWLLQLLFLLVHSSIYDSNLENEDLKINVYQNENSEFSNTKAKNGNLFQISARGDFSNSQPARNVYNHEVSLPKSNINKKNKEGGSSIAFVFDTTGSMWDDLMAVRQGAKKILKTALTTPNSPITNFVLVPFADPKIGPVTETDDPEIFQNALENLWVSGGRDCPEMALGGIKKALELSKPYSQIYVFTDASAKDYHLINEVLNLIQEKQAQVVFVLTGDCGNRSASSYISYEQVAITSSGQVFHLKKKRVKTVVKFIEKNIVPNKVYLMTRDYRGTGSHSLNLPIDPTIEEVTISISGENRHLSVTDDAGKKIYPIMRKRYNGRFRGRNQRNNYKSKQVQNVSNLQNQNANVKAVLSLPNALIVNIKNPKKGNLLINVSATGVHSIRVTGRSSFDFQARFSNFRETAFADAASSPTAIFDEEDTSNQNNDTSSQIISQPRTFTPINLSGYDKIAEKTQIWSLAFINSQGDIISSSSLQKTGQNTMIPQKFMEIPHPKKVPSWYIQLEGEIDGYDFVRLSKSAIVPRKPEKPEVILAGKMEASFGNDFDFHCQVRSDLPYQISLEHMESKSILGPLAKQQSGDIIFQLKEIGKELSGNYKCQATNKMGTSSASTILSVGDPPPNIQILDGRIDYIVNINEDLLLNCNVDANGRKYSMGWYFLGNIISRQNILELTKIDWHDGGKYTCIARTENNVVSSAFVLVKVVLPPKIKISFNNDPLVLAKLLNDYSEIFDGENNDWKMTKIQQFTPNSAIYLTKNELAIFNCDSIEGEPKPGISWTRKVKNEDLEDSDEIDLISDQTEKKENWILSPNNQTLTIFSNKNNQGIFTCYGTNPGGVHVEYVEIFYKELPKISITQPEKSYILPKNSNFKLNCGITSGYPMPSLKWTFTPLNENGVADAEKITDIQFDRSELSLNNLSAENAGIYHCVAENVYGSDYDQVLIDVGYPPQVLGQGPGEAELIVTKLRFRGFSDIFYFVFLFFFLVFCYFFCFFICISFIIFILLPLFLLIKQQSTQQN